MSFAQGLRLDRLDKTPALNVIYQRSPRAQILLRPIIQLPASGLSATAKDNRPAKDGCENAIRPDAKRIFR